MPNTNTVEINTNTNRKTQGEFAIDFQASGFGGMIPVINGQKEYSLMFGYASESDKQACIALITEAALVTDGDIFAMRSYIMNATAIAAEGIKPDETVDVDGIEMLISYEQKAIYLGTEKIADLEDIESDLGNEATKIILVERARNVLNEREREAEEEDDFDIWYGIE